MTTFVRSIDIPDIYDTIVYRWINYPIFLMHRNNAVEETYKNLYKREFLIFHNEKIEPLEFDGKLFLPIVVDQLHWPDTYSTENYSIMIEDSKYKNEHFIKYTKQSEHLATRECITEERDLQTSKLTDQIFKDLAREIKRINLLAEEQIIQEFKGLSSNLEKQIENDVKDFEVCYFSIEDETRTIGVKVTHIPTQIAHTQIDHSENLDPDKSIQILREILNRFKEKK